MSGLTNELGFSIDDKRSLRAIALCDNSDIKEVLEYLRIKDETGVKRLTINIILVAVNDLDALYERAIMFHDKCASGKLMDYYETTRSENLLPFRERDDMEAIYFFSGSEWGGTVLDSCGIGALPPLFKGKVEYLVQANENWDKHCKYCVRKIKNKMTRDKRNKKEFGNASK